jgi:hypothetical protein
MPPAGQSINLLSPGNGINIPSKTEYEKNKVLTIYNIIRQLKLLARIHCVIMPLTRLAHSVEYIFIEDAEERLADPTYPEDPEENKRLNMLVYTYLLTIMGPLWAGVHTARISPPSNRRRITAALQPGKQDRPPPPLWTRTPSPSLSTHASRTAQRMTRTTSTKASRMATPK